MIRPNEGNLSQAAVPFNITQYLNEIPKIVKEALKLNHWKKAMQDVIKALQK